MTKSIGHCDTFVDIDLMTKSGCSFVLNHFCFVFNVILNWKLWTVTTRLSQMPQSLTSQILRMIQIESYFILPSTLCFRSLTLRRKELCNFFYQCIFSFVFIICRWKMLVCMLFGEMDMMFWLFVLVYVILSWLICYMNNIIHVFVFFVHANNFAPHLLCILHTRSWIFG